MAYRPIQLHRGQLHPGNQPQTDSRSGGFFLSVALSFSRRGDHVRKRLFTHSHLYAHRVLTPVASFARAVSDNSAKSTGPTIGDSQIDNAGFLGEAEKLLVIDDDPALDECDGTREVTLGTRERSKFDGIQAEKPEAQQVLAGSAPVRHDLAHVTVTSRKSLLMDQVLRQWENV